jgi:hypothetical protein
MGFGTLSVTGRSTSTIQADVFAENEYLKKQVSGLSKEIDEKMKRNRETEMNALE